MALCSRMKIGAHHVEPEPPAGDERRAQGRVVRKHQPVAGTDHEFAVHPAAPRQLILRRGAAAVQLRRVPPGRLGVQEGLRSCVVVHPGGIRQRLEHLQRLLRPRVVLGEGQLKMELRVTATVAEPVLDHELNPRGGEQIQACRRDEVVPGQQLPADLPRVRIQDPVRRFLVSPLQGDVAAEAGACHAHGRAAEIVVGSVRRPGRQRLGGRGPALWGRRRTAGSMCRTDCAAAGCSANR